MTIRMKWSHTHIHATSLTQFIEMGSHDGKIYEAQTNWIWLFGVQCLKYTFTEYWLHVQCIKITHFVLQTFALMPNRNKGQKNGKWTFWHMIMWNLCGEHFLVTACPIMKKKKTINVSFIRNWIQKPNKWNLTNHNGGNSSNSSISTSNNRKTISSDLFTAFDSIKMTNSPNSHKTALIYQCHEMEKNPFIRMS